MNIIFIIIGSPIIKIVNIIWNFINSFIMEILRKNLEYISLWIIGKLMSFKIKILSILYDIIQPKKIADNLVYPIILLFSKVLYIFPLSVRQSIVKFYRKLLNTNRHISNEEISVVLLLLIIIIIYLISLIIWHRHI